MLRRTFPARNRLTGGTSATPAPGEWELPSSPVYVFTRSQHLIRTVIVISPASDALTENIRVTRKQADYLSPLSLSPISFPQRNAAFMPHKSPELIPTTQQRL
jgi:hypothetical protein